MRVESEARLVIPDYAGNNHYNTIGNLVMDPRAGLLFVDFARGSLLQLTGRTTIDWDSEALAGHPGARRLVIFDLDEAVELFEKHGAYAEAAGCLHMASRDALERSARDEAPRQRVDRRAPLARPWR